MLKGVVLLLLAVNLWPTVDSLPNGAPKSVCRTLLPFHGGGIPPMSSPSPFSLEATSPVVGQGQSIRIEIVGQPLELQFIGLMIHARNAIPPHQIIGKFSTQVTDPTIKYIDCEGESDTATHTGRQPKQGVSLEWIAPTDFLGDVIFNATVAVDYSQFWVGISSNPVKVVKRGAAPPSVIGISTTRPPITTTIPAYVPKTTQTPKAIDPMYQNCHDTKICFGFPDGCLESQNCRTHSTIKVNGDKYEFELKSGFDNPVYVAIGLSNDDKMGDDAVMECVAQNGEIKLYNSWTNARPNLGVTRDAVPQNVARLLSSSYTDGTIYCRFQRDAETNVKGQSFDLVNRKYFLLLAAGSSLKDNSVGYHNLGRLPSGSPVNLAVVQVIQASSTLLLRLHGAFMIVAWIGTTSLGILLARYFKHTWVGSQLCGKDQWFAWHRMCMIVTWSLTIAGFVIIFVELGAWSSERNPHAILGVITTAICFFQPIGAVFRPAPNSKNRPYFNWLHWAGGNIAHILAIVTIFFAVKLTKAELPEWFDWILVAYVAFHVVMHLMFSIAGCASDRQASQRVNSFPMSDMSPARGNIKVDRKQDAPFASMRNLLLGIYIVILIIFVVALVVIVVLAPVDNTVEKTVERIKTTFMKIDYDISNNNTRG